jgi:DNA-binding winged helix-turn-helix (wHTH) protein
MDPATVPATLLFGKFELSVTAGILLLDGRRLKMQPQPFKLLVLLARRAGTMVSREEIRQELWPDGTFVDFDQAVNFAVKQIRDALGDNAERPIYVETVPRRGYRFIAPVDSPKALPADGGTTVRLQKALWQNVAELRLAEERRKRQTVVVLSILTVLVLAVLAIVLLNM